MEEWEYNSCINSGITLRCEVSFMSQRKSPHYSLSMGLYRPQSQVDILGTRIPWICWKSKHNSSAIQPRGLSLYTLHNPQSHDLLVTFINTSNFNSPLQLVYMSFISFSIHMYYKLTALKSLQPDDAVEQNTVRNCVNQFYLHTTYCIIRFSKVSVKICCIKYYYCEVWVSH